MRAAPDPSQRVWRGGAALMEWRTVKVIVIAAGTLAASFAVIGWAIASLVEKGFAGGNAAAAKGTPNRGVIPQ